MSKERLDKILSNNGMGTRKTVRPLVWRGHVSVNGQVATNPDQKVDVETDVIEVDGKALLVRRNICIMMNKPSGYVCSAKSGLHETVFDLLPPELPLSFLGGDLGMVGRLDVDTEGLLLFTSDGILNHKLTSPKYRVSKVYLVTLRDSVSLDERKRYEQMLSQGIHIAAEGHEEAWDCLPAQIEWTSKDTVCKVTVYEGKFHEVKRMFAALGNEVLALKRLQIGGVKLDENLAPGQIRELTSEEMDALFTTEVLSE